LERLTDLGFMAIQVARTVVSPRSTHGSLLADNRRRDWLGVWSQHQSMSIKGSENLNQYAIDWQISEQLRLDTWCMLCTRRLIMPVWTRQVCSGFRHLLGTILCICFFSSVSLNAQQNATPTQTNGTINWGDEQSGVRVGVSADKLTYELGEDILIHVFLENVSDSQPVYGEPFRPRPAYDAEMGSVQIAVLDEDGPLPVRLDVNSVLIGRVGGGPSLCPAPFVRGVPVTLDRNLRRIGLLPPNPGAYKIVAVWKPYTTRFVSCDAVPGELPSDLEQPFVTAKSGPVDINIAGVPNSNTSRVPEYTEWRRSFELVDSSFGEKTALLDRATHLEWLRLNFTANLSYNQVRKALQPGGTFEGWRLATVRELRTFFANFTGTEDGRSHDLSMERKLQRLLGGPLEESNDPAHDWHRTSGYVGDPIGPDNHMIHYHMGYIGEESGFLVEIDPFSEGSAISGFFSPSEGTFLVRSPQ
jgi:hypothetical protein